jgi:hypothetical protein
MDTEAAMATRASNMQDQTYANSVKNMSSIAHGVFITDQLFLPRYIWHKVKFSLPQIKEKIMYFQDVQNRLLEVKILYSKGAARIRHLAELSHSLKEL